MQASRHDNVLAPGPVNLHPKVQEALALPMIHHRTPEFDAILKNVLRRLKDVFCTKQDCFLLSSTGTGGMEALLVNCMKPGDTVLGIDSGKFGERWCEMVQTFGGKLLRYKVEWGKAASPSEVQNRLKANPEIRVVLCQACETSTGVKHPIQALGEVVHAFPHVLFLVDGITALGAYPLMMDEWFIDGLVGGSQKAFMLPTGMTLLSLSEKAWRVARDNPMPRFYFDLRKELAANQKGETYFSSNVTLIRALNVVMDLIDEIGQETLYSQIERRALFTRKFSDKLGLKLFAETPSESLTALLVPPQMDSQLLRHELEQKYKTTVMGGQDQAKGKILRIGHMGHILPEQMVQLMLDLRELLQAKDPSLALPEVEAFRQQMQEYWK